MIYRRGKRRQLKRKIQIDPGAAVADTFMGSMYWSFAPLMIFTVIHFNLIMFVRRRNRLINARLTKYARVVGMREPRRLRALQRFFDDLTPSKGGDPRRIELKPVQQTMFKIDDGDLAGSWRNVKEHLVNSYPTYPEWELENGRKNKKKGGGMFKGRPTPWICVLKAGVDTAIETDGIVCRTFTEAESAFKSLAKQQDAARERAIKSIMKNAAKMFEKVGGCAAELPQSGVTTHPHPHSHFTPCTLPTSPYPNLPYPKLLYPTLPYSTLLYPTLPYPYMLQP